MSILTILTVLNRKMPKYIYFISTSTPFTYIRVNKTLRSWYMERMEGGNHTLTKADMADVSSSLGPGIEVSRQKGSPMCSLPCTKETLYINDILYCNRLANQSSVSEITDTDRHIQCTHTRRHTSV